MYFEVGQTIPPDTAHAVSVSLPTWKANVGYEEGEEWVLSKMKSGYPRFFIDTCIADFAQLIIDRHGKAGEAAMLFPTYRIASRCVEFLNAQDKSSSLQQIRIVQLVPNPSKDPDGTVKKLASNICAVLYPVKRSNAAKMFWQHSGDGVSSRRAEFARRAYQAGYLVEKRASGTIDAGRMCKGPKRYQRNPSTENAQALMGQSSQTNGARPIENGKGAPDSQDEYLQFIEERFGRNLETSFVSNAKLAIRRRIAGSLTADVDLREAVGLEDRTEQARMIDGFSVDDVYLHPTGMSSIFNTHRALMEARGPMESICFGFPYIDTLKILQKWGPGCLFYGHGSTEDLDDLERRLVNGQRYLALFCEFPGNPLLKSPDLQRIRALADKYDFAIVVDETVGNFLNVHVLPYTDVLVSSLTKVFSGDSNVMGGSSVLNPTKRYYAKLKETLHAGYEDSYWAEDSIFMERNSRDFVSRIERINVNAEAVAETLKSHPRVKEVYYPKYSPTRANYNHCRNANGGYGGLLSATFFSTADAVTFFDRLETAKGPSLGTNFTLASPYTLLAHYGELAWASQFGVEVDLIRISVGLEETGDLVSRFQRALAAIS